MKKLFIIVIALCYCAFFSVLSLAGEAEGPLLQQASAAAQQDQASNTTPKETPPPPVYEHYGLSLCSAPGYHCIAVPKYSTWSLMFPNKRTRDIIMRVNRTNVVLRYRKWLIIPNDVSSVNYMSLAPFPHTIAAPKKNVLVVDLRKFAFGAYGPDGNLLYWGPAAGGMRWCKDTDSDCQTQQGTYKIYRIQGASCVSGKYPIGKGGAPMPWCMHYYKGFAIHGSTLLGFYNHSRGCVRLFDQDAKWLNQHFVHYGTEVIVKR